MKIHEYQAKEILKEHGIPVPAGDAVENPKEGLALSKELGFPLAIKAQVYAGGRGKAGAIRIVSSSQELEKELLKVLGMRVKGLKVKKVLIEKALDINKQFYLGIIVDRSKQGNAIVASTEGGIDIEEVARLYPEKIVNQPLKKIDTLEEDELNKLISSLELQDSIHKPFADIVKSLFAAYINIDAQLAEINPLVLTKENQLIACDAKITIDDNALFRHENLMDLKEEAEDNELEIQAHKRGLAYVKLSGNIGIIGNGAGLVMATMDEVKRVGGKPANFLDIGGGAKREVMQNALEIIYMDKQVNGVFINVFGGITRCDEVARGIIQVMKKTSKDVPVVLRLTGTKSEEGKKLLEKSNLITTDTMEEGAKRTVELTNNK